MSRIDRSQDPKSKPKKPHVVPEDVPEALQEFFMRLLDPIVKEEEEEEYLGYVHLQFSCASRFALLNVVITQIHRTRSRSSGHVTRSSGLPEAYLPEVQGRHQARAGLSRAGGAQRQGREGRLSVYGSW